MPAAAVILVAMKRPAARLERNGTAANWVLEFQTLEQVEVAMCLLKSRVASARDNSTRIAIQAFEPVQGEPGILVKWKSAVLLTSVKSFVYDWLQKEMDYRPGVRPAVLPPAAAPPFFGLRMQEQLCVEPSQVEKEFEAHYVMEDTICGRGNSIVQKALQRVTNEPVAIKLVEADHRVEAMREVAALEMLRHENIVRLLDVFASSNGTKLVFELWGSDLGKRIASAPSLSPGDIHTLTKQMFSAVAYVHDMGLCHNDIKPKNMLVQGDLLKLCDFGLTYQLGRRVCECSEYVRRYGLQQQTLRYRAPEVLLGDTTFGAPADIWSLAVTVLHMVTSESPWQPRWQYGAILDIFKILGTSCAADWPNVSNLVHWKANFPSFPKRSLASTYPSVPAGVLNFVSSILVCNPGKRLTAREACHHAYLIPQPSKSGVSKRHC